MHTTDTVGFALYFIFLGMCSQMTNRPTPNSSQCVEGSAWRIHSLSPVCRTSDPARGAGSQVVHCIMVTCCAKLYNVLVVFLSANLYPSLCAWFLDGVDFTLHRSFFRLFMLCTSLGCLLLGSVELTWFIDSVCVALQAHVYRFTNHACCSGLRQPESIHCSRRRHKP